MLFCIAYCIVSYPVVVHTLTADSEGKCPEISFTWCAVGTFDGCILSQGGDVQ